MGRFPQRPYYEQFELNHECEELVTSFLLNKYGKVRYPINTDDLTVLIEQHTGDLDLYVDLSEEGDKVEGVTEFVANGRLRVIIAREPSQQPWQENRL